MYAQTTTTTTIPDTTAETVRPITDFVVELFDLDRDGPIAGLLGLLVEPFLQVLLITIIAWVVVRVLRRLLRRWVERIKRRGGSGPLGLDLGFGSDPDPASTRTIQRIDGLGSAVSSVVGFVVWIVAVVTILGSTFGINIGPLIAGAGILGVALGFGAQSLVKDLLSGFFMLLEDQYGVGDVVDVGEATGVVEGVGLRTTRVRDVTGTLWHIPNGEIRRVGNMSQEWSRALLDIAVAYTADIDAASEVIKLVADEMVAEEDYRHLFLAPPEIWGVEALSTDSVVIRLVVKTKPGEQWAIARELRRRIKTSLEEAEIEIPFQQRNVWVRDGGGMQYGTERRDPTASSAATGKAAVEEGASATSDGHTDPPEED